MKRNLLFAAAAMIFIAAPVANAQQIVAQSNYVNRGQQAAVAYFLGFIADAVLRLALQQDGGDASARSSGPTTMAAPEAVGGLPVDPVWLVLGAVFLLGVLVIVASRRLRRQRAAGELNF